MVALRKPLGFWNFSRCLSDAKKYSTRSEWIKSSSSAYQAAHANGWLDECCSHMKVSKNLLQRAIYAIEFSDNSVYVGLTWNYNERLQSHIDSSNNAKVKRKIDEGVAFDFRKFGVWYEAEEAGTQEAKTLSEYRKAGWYILNIGRVGKSSSLGSPIARWTQKRCIEDAKKYNTLAAWREGSPAGISAAYKRGWIEECSEHMEHVQNPNGYWTKERCAEDARNYRFRGEWGKYSPAAYSAARKKGWLDECCTHMSKAPPNRLFWTKERCLKEAKKYSTRVAWRKASQGSVNAAQKNGWLDECCMHMRQLRKPKGYWTRERCIKDAQKYVSLSLWRKSSASAYAIASRNNWMDDCCAHMN